MKNLGSTLTIHGKVVKIDYIFLASLFKPGKTVQSSRFQVEYFYF